MIVLRLWKSKSSNPLLSDCSVRSSQGDTLLANINLKILAGEAVGIIGSQALENQL